MAYPYSSYNYGNYNNSNNMFQQQTSPYNNMNLNQMQQMQQPQQTLQYQQQIYLPITYINGYNEAKRFVVFPNQTIFLKDDENEVLYEKQVDSAGKVYLRPYKLTQLKLDDLESGKALSSDNQYASKSDVERLESVVLDKINTLKTIIETTLLNNNATPLYDTSATDSSTSSKNKLGEENK